MPKRKRTNDDQGCSRSKPMSITSAFEFENSRFHCFSINYPTTCRSSEGRPCDIFRDLTTWNKFFTDVGLLLRELYPGQLSLVTVDGLHIPLESPRRQHAAATLLHRLLIYHSCLVSVVLTSRIIENHNQLICDALPKSPSLRKLEVCMCDITMLESQSFAVAFPLLNHLQELNCEMNTFERSFCEGLSELLVNTASLMTLKLSANFMEDEDGVVIFNGLKRNRTVTTLSLGRCVSRFLPQCGFVFADYLCENQTLRSLSVTSCCPKDDYVPSLIIRSLFSNTTISEVSLVDFSLDNENSRFVAEMLSENRSLRAFHMVECDLYSSHRVTESDGVSGRICPWITALGENATVERLTMDLSCFNLEECRSLFKAIASNKSLKSIAVDRFLPTTEICRALRETGLLERFSFSRPHVVSDPVITLRECKELSYISITPTALSFFDSFHTALDLLPSCNHVTSLALRGLRLRLEDNTMSLMAPYIKATKVLRYLKISSFPRTSSTMDRPERLLMQALCFNNSIRKLFIRGIYFDEVEIQMLVDKLQASRTLYNLSYLPYLDKRSANLLTQKLSPRVSSNYTLLGMQLCRCWPMRDDLFAIGNVVRRNLSLVTRAAHFVMGTRHRYCAAAAELVHWNPGLVAKVQALASVDENEAVSRIENSVKSFSELDDFMCVAGVVKYGVTCHRRDDGQLQLTDLSRDCWLHIRQYLKMGDILDAW
ncbi:uncharacterized protein LOC119400063 isoform X2 [Rhipicephalus sanguineus]|uniref:Nlr family card domain protein n=1 Tax=Rhipicephalus sanguineus TaxID=34632 RepID=A0A9D4PIG2_RHISA|nr:uncharacterized protein LOC119400063 isoform X2 [Rhipicephalus sanguineus]KAH7943842.1 hypothetical protein HPB52_011985 [Rhipicephalus sanguineus]